MLTDQDSNLDRQNQNLQCYRYTIGQCFVNGLQKYKKNVFATIFFKKSSIYFCLCYLQVQVVVLEIFCFVFMLFCSVIG